MPKLREKIWKDLPNQSTPITADDLNFFENHLFDGEGGGHVIVDPLGLEMANQAKLQFQGSGVTEVKNEADKTIVMISGEKGDAATINIGIVETISPSENATVTNSGNENNAIFNFKIPKGEKGERGVQGLQGNQGIQGVPGNSPTIVIGNIETVENNIPAEVTNSGTNTNVILNFKLPKGKNGTGVGDMMKSVYDADNDGIVDSAKLAQNANKVNNFSVLRDVKVDEYTNEEIDQKLVSIMRHKGSVQSYTDLNNISSKKRGDVYNVIDTGDNYAWTGIDWDKLGGIIDLTDYYNKSAINSLLLLKQNKLLVGDNITIDSNNKISASSKITTEEFVITPANWQDQASGDYKAFYDKETSTNYTNAKSATLSYPPSNISTRKNMADCGVAIYSITSNTIKFIAIDKKPTENITLQVVFIW